MSARTLWSRILCMAGSIAMLVGAIDPMEGSLLILPGSALVALGTFLGQGERRLVTYRVWVFALIAIGVAALWGLSAVGGFGGSSGHSNWWGVLVLPYFLGWSMGIWGTGSPRWVLWLGIVVSAWYMTLFAALLHRAGANSGLMSALPAIVLGATGMVTIGGCIKRLLSLRKAMPVGL